MNKIIVIVVLLGLVKWWYTDPTVSSETNNIEFSYIVKYSGGARSGDQLPMLVALHGNGDSPQNFYDSTLTQIKMPARIILIEGPIPHGRGNAWPWDSADFAKYGKAMNEAIESLTYEYPTSQKPILFGFSGGGMMAYYQAIKHGYSYSYVVPVSGQLSKEQLGDDTISLGANIIAFHGKSDDVVSIGGGRNAIKMLKENGANARFIEFDGGHQGIFSSMKSEISELVDRKIATLN